MSGTENEHIKIFNSSMPFLYAAKSLQIACDHMKSLQSIFGNVEITPAQAISSIVIRSERYPSKFGQMTALRGRIPVGSNHWWWKTLQNHCTTTHLVNSGETKTDPAGGFTPPQATVDAVWTIRHVGKP
jgi:hypothetical protein